MEIHNSDKVKRLEQFNIEYDVQKGSDVLISSKIKAKDLFAHDKKINKKMSDIFPQPSNDQDDKFLG